MRINSNFTDLYDYLLSYGIDTSITYNRFTEVIPLPPNVSHPIEQVVPRFRSYTYYNGDFLNRTMVSVSPVTLFIGSFFKNFLIINDTKSDTIKWYGDVEEVRTELQTSGCDDNSFFQYYHRHHMNTHNYLNYTWSDSQREIINGLYTKYNSPVLMVSSEDPIWQPQKSLLTINPCIKDTKALKFITPEHIMQLIEECFINVINMNSMPMPKIDDISMRDSKGFDEKSFKKSPTKRFKLNK